MDLKNEHSTQISKNQIRQIARIRERKYRYKQGCFVAEGVKGVEELLKSTHIKTIALFLVSEVLHYFKPYKVSKKCITQIDLKKISHLKTPQKVLGIFKIPDFQKYKIPNKNLILALDGINDPGNLGTIIRLCDWFGVTDLLCSKNTVDCFNPKVVQATMGSLAKIRVHYTDLETFCKQISLPIYATSSLQGKNMYQVKLPSNAVLLMGNESKGISKHLLQFSENHLYIPSFPNSENSPESLNVATATAIALSEFRRNTSIER